MSEKLKPCPFCGGKAIMVTFEKEKVLADYPEHRDKIRTMPSKWIRMGCETPDCILYADVEAHTVKLGFLGGCEEEATKMWNRRASAEPERKKGKWMPFDNPWYKCSECGAVRENKSFMENFCPNCGADMRGEDDE